MHGALPYLFGGVHIIIATMNFALHFVYEQLKLQLVYYRL